MKQGGFTLIEVMVAIAILAMITLLVWQSSAITILSKERYEKEDALMHEMSLVLNRIADDLATAFILVPTSDFIGRTPAGEVLTKTVFMGQDQGDQDKMTFVGFSHVRYLKDTKECDQAEISYFTEVQADNPGFFNLMKREVSPIDSDPEAGGKKITVVEGIKSFNLRFYDDGRGEWIGEWDSTSLEHPHKLPKAVEIVLTALYPSEEEETEEILTFRTIAFMEMGVGPHGF